MNRIYTAMAGAAVALLLAGRAGAQMVGGEAPHIFFYRSRSPTDGPPEIRENPFLPLMPPAPRA
jgi:hypothetical protein